MQKIDAHQHFWKFNAVRDSWITDNMSVIQRDFLPQDLLPVLTDNGLDGCIAVQSDQSEADNEFLLNLAQEHPFIKGVVGWVDLQAENIEERLAFYSQFPAMKGFRHVLQGEADRALMLKPAFKRGIKALRKYGFTYDVLIYQDQLQYAAELAEAYPDQKFVLDHLAKPSIREQALNNWAQDIRLLAAHENVCCKVSGMVTEADWKNWKPADFNPFLDVVFEAFGARRLLYGSDWPVCLVAGGYEEVIAIVKDYTSSLSGPEQALFWGGNAMDFYNITE